MRAAFPLLGLALAACGAPTPLAEPGRPFYSGEAVIEPAAASLAAEWTIHFIADSSMADGVSLLLNERLDVTRLDGPDVASFEEGPWQEGSGWKRIAVSWAEPAPPGSPREIHVAYGGVPFDSLPPNAINSIRPDWIELGLDSGWLPVVESFDQDLIGELTLHVPGSWTVVASGDVSEVEGGYLVRNEVPLVDFAFAAGTGLARSGPDSVSVFHEGTDPATVQRVVEAAATCRDWLTDRFGPLPALKFVLAPRDDSGYARKNYIVLTRVDDFAPADLSRFVCHELAHYWSSSASPSTADYWMTEGLAELVAARHVRDAHGDSAYATIRNQWRSQSADLPPVWTDTSTARPPFRISYRKAPLVLSELSEELGDEAFSEFLRLYMTSDTRTTRELLDHMETAGGPDARDALEAALAN